MHHQLEAMKKEHMEMKEMIKEGFERLEAKPLQQKAPTQAGAAAAGSTVAQVAKKK